MMNYKEFKKTYSWMVKKYPETSNIYKRNLSEIIGHTEIVNYTKTGSGWNEDSKRTEDVTRKYYANVVDAVPFFRNLGGKEQVVCGYTKYGYIPTEISSISPDGKSKVLRKFIIER